MRACERRFTKVSESVLELLKNKISVRRSLGMRSSSTILILLTLGCSSAHAAVNCQGALTQAQRAGFERMFSPPFSIPSLVPRGGGSIDLVRRLDASRLQSLSKSPAPVASQTLTGAHAALLRKWLNENATDSVPGWVSAVIGTAAMVIAAPPAWVGLGADALMQLGSGAGDAGRLQLANLAGTVTAEGKIGVIEQAADNLSGQPKLIFSYVYTGPAQVNNKQVTSLLAMCSVDVVVSSAVTRYSDCPAGGIDYCYCAYEKDLEGLKQQYNDRETMRKGVAAVKGGLDQCISRGGK